MTNELVALLTVLVIGTQPGQTALPNGCTLLVSQTLPVAPVFQQSSPTDEYTWLLPPFPTGATLYFQVFLLENAFTLSDRATNGASFTFVP